MRKWRRSFAHLKNATLRNTILDILNNPAEGQKIPEGITADDCPAGFVKANADEIIALAGLLHRCSEMERELTAAKGSISILEEKLGNAKREFYREQADYEAYIQDNIFLKGLIEGKRKE